MKKTGGVWSMDVCPRHFAAYVDTSYHNRYAESVLMAVPELVSDVLCEIVSGWIENGTALLIDSGVFGCAMAHAKKHGLDHDAGLRVPIAELDGFDKLMKDYRKVIGAIGEHSWGYVEVDLGGREQKIKTRAMLEGEGFRPIPVVHPLNDGWDYFDQLADEYDRLCIGNLVKANEATRRAILYEVGRRRQGKNVKWIHALGVTSGSLWLAFPTESCDSSAFAATAMFGGPITDRVAFQKVDCTRLRYSTEEYKAMRIIQGVSVAVLDRACRHRLRGEMQCDR